MKRVRPRPPQANAGWSSLCDCGDDHDPHLGIQPTASELLSFQLMGSVHADAIWAPLNLREPWSADEDELSHEFDEMYEKQGKSKDSDGLAIISYDKKKRDRATERCVESSKGVSSKAAITEENFSGEKTVQNENARWQKKVVCNDEDARSSVVGMDTSGVDAESFPLSQTPTLAESGGTASFALASAAPSTVVCNPGRKPYRPAASMKSGDTSDGASHPASPLRPSRKLHASIE